MYRKAAARGSAYAQSRLRSLTAGGESAPQDREEVADEARGVSGHEAAKPKSAVSGAQESARAAPRRYVSPPVLLREAAERGDARSEANLGEMFERGLGGLPKNEAQAAYWFRKAADHGDVVAQLALGAMYREGRGVPKDELAGSSLAPSGGRT